MSSHVLHSPVRVAVLLTGLVAVALGVIGLVGRISLFIRPGHGVYSVGLSWGSRWEPWSPSLDQLPAIGLVAFGAGCLGFWWGGDRARWSIRLTWTGIALVALGVLDALLLRRVV